jgi:hypothetical protein
MSNSDTPRPGGWSTAVHPERIVSPILSTPEKEYTPLQSSIARTDVRKPAPLLAALLAARRPRGADHATTNRPTTGRNQRQDWLCEVRT